MFTWKITQTISTIDGVGSYAAPEYMGSHVIEVEWSYSPTDNDFRHEIVWEGLRSVSQGSVLVF